MNILLTDLQAYQIMICFLEKHYFRTKSEDIGSLLGDLTLLNKRISADPAAWTDWESCIKEVTKMQ